MNEAFQALERGGITMVLLDLLVSQVGSIAPFLTRARQAQVRVYAFPRQWWHYDYLTTVGCKTWTQVGELRARHSSGLQELVCELICDELSSEMPEGRPEEEGGGVLQLALAS